MAKGVKVFKAAKDFNVGVPTLLEFFKKRGIPDITGMNDTIPDDLYQECIVHFAKDRAIAERMDQKSKELQSIKEKSRSTVIVDKGEEPVAKPVAKVEPKKEVIPEVKPIPEPVEEPKAVQPEPEIVEPEPIPVVEEVIPEPEPIAEVPVVESEPVVEHVDEDNAEEDVVVEVDAIADEASPDADERYKSHDKHKQQEIKITLKGKIDLNKVNEVERDHKKRKRKRKGPDGPVAVSREGSSATNRPTSDRPQTQRQQQDGDKRKPQTTRSMEDLKSVYKKEPGESFSTLASGSNDPNKAKKKETPGVKKDKFVEDDSAKAAAKKKRVKKGKVVELTDSEVQTVIRTTLASMDESAFTGRNAAKKRKKKEREIAEIVKAEEKLRQSTIIKVTDFASANELAGLMSVPVNEVLSKCLALGLFVSINQRLEKDHIELLAGEFGYQVEFQQEFAEDIANQSDEDPADMIFRPPVVTIMGHVDHGKTSLLDYIRSANVVAGEAGGITQHIGAYAVTLPDGRMISFLDTPGHEAFTAMRARGAKVTDVAIIVVASDDSVMPQTVEAINHAQAAGVPMVFAINKIDKPGANVERIYQQLSEKNILVEEWGGKFQVGKVSAKTGVGVQELLEKVLLESEILNLKANPKRRATGTVVEAELDKGKGVVTTLLVQNGTLKVGDIFVCGASWGRVRALVDERGHKMKTAGPSVPAQVLGFDSVPQAGDTFVVLETEREAREIANKRMIIKREQEQRRAAKHMSLDMISQRMSEGSIKDLNIIVKGDVDGSVEALSDSLMKLSTGEVRVRVIHKAVGPITESDVVLASASDAIIIGFQVRPNLNAKKLAITEEIDIRLYSIIYDAINEVKLALEGMLSPELSEEILATVEIREIFKISRIGTIAGCYVLDGKINRNNKVRIIRDGVVIYTGDLGSLKRFKDDVKDVEKGFECGLNINNFNDIKIGDHVEAFKVVETKRKL